MPANPNILTYSAADLFRYAKGSMTAAEMHALEKAALEDPFLAEALEGFMEAAHTQDEVLLQKKIEQLPPSTTESKGARIVPFWQRSAFKMAIAALFVSGAGWLIFSLVQPKSSSNSPELAQKTTVLTDSITTKAAGPQDYATTSPMLADSQAIAYKPVDANVTTKPAQQNQSMAEAKTSSQPTFATISPATESNDIKQQEMAEVAQVPTTMADSTANRADIASGSFATKSFAKEESERMMNRRMSAMRYNYYGRITDPQGNALPYTNVSIVGQDFGTYTDASGNFNFISEDSTLPVRTRSLGYLPQNITLTASRQQTKIVLHEDDKLKNNLAVVMPPSQGRMRSASATIVERDSIEGAEPTPKVGFYDYNLYLANNNRVSDMQQLGKQVKLSFDIDKDGNATNITIAQSSGETLDNEAIRLLKEGPKWKGKSGKKGSVIIKF